VNWVRGREAVLDQPGPEHLRPASSEGCLILFYLPGNFG
jgi:hypothetical protein